MGMLQDPTFWQKEKECSLLKAEVQAGFLKRHEASNYEELFAIARGWCTTLGLTDAEIAAERAAFDAQAGDPDFAFERIFERDADRTFKDRGNRVRLMHILTLVQARLEGDYHQGVSMVVGFLLLTLDAGRVLAVVARLLSDPRFIPQVRQRREGEAWGWGRHRRITRL